ncbi:MAG TPA: hypothetical protein VNM48_08120 [Chloroflexota bacterium]|nr:hypothetical protein [Chloroflexota bacterium]
MSGKTGTPSATGATTNDQNRGLLDTSVLIAQETGRRPTIQDTWIAATAVTHTLPLYTQGDGFAGIPQVRVVRS